MKYIFSLGRDNKLAKLELVSILHQADFKYSVISESEQFMLLDFQENINGEALVKRLAGTIRIAEVIDEVAGESSIDFAQTNLYLDQKINYAIFGYGKTAQILNTMDKKLKDFFRKFKIRAVEKGHAGDLPTPAEFSSWRLKEGLELICAESDGVIFIARSIAAPDWDAFQVKDEQRPARRFTHGTSFRLAQMMVNILDARLGAVVVDPFCGTGTFLIEGLSKGYEMIGIDNDPALISDAGKNLKWAKQKFNSRNNYELLCADSRSAEFKADGCVFEPYMGPFLKKLPNFEKAKEIMHDLEKFYLKIFDNLARNLANDAKIVCILPYLSSYDGKKVYLSEKFYSSLPFKHTDLKSAYGISMENPIEYTTPSGSRINRQVHIFQGISKDKIK